MSLTNKATSRIPLYLVPAFAPSIPAPLAIARSFSATACHEARSRTKRKGNRDSNKQRGVSAIRSTGPRQRLSIDKHYKELPRPRSESERPQLEGVEINPKHGLYGFFTKNKETVLTPENEEFHGRAWTYHDLCFKNFEDLHALYWQCVLESNRIQTRNLEFRRLKLGYGSAESRRRYETVQGTMKEVRRVLLNRQNAYEEAKLLLEQKSLTQLDEEMVRQEEEAAAEEHNSESHALWSGEELHTTTADAVGANSDTHIPRSSLEGPVNPGKEQGQSRASPSPTL